MKLLGVITLLSTLFVIGCSSSADFDTYDVRAKVAGVDKAQHYISLLHEEIPEFKDPEGNIGTMNPMMMLFSVSKAIDLSEISEKDNVSITFQTRWKKHPKFHITKLEKLSGDTVLNLQGYSLES